MLRRKPRPLHLSTPAIKTKDMPLTPLFATHASRLAAFSPACLPLRPFATSLTHHPSSKSFHCHSYPKIRGQANQLVNTSFPKRDATAWKFCGDVAQQCCAPAIGWTDTISHSGGRGTAPHQDREIGTNKKFRAGMRQEVGSSASAWRARSATGDLGSRLITFWSSAVARVLSSIFL